jgi:NDP-sugar pyrophosphorylase family protein
MQIIIPMSGYGERFRAEGYDLPKPLIDVAGKPMIAHVINLFPNEKKIIFICNEEHLNNKHYKMKETILNYCPTGKIYSIKSHKLGPVHAILDIKSKLDEDEEVVVNYCDFSCYWDWFEFKKFIIYQNCEGAIPAYRGFHPHSLGHTNYAYIKQKNNILKDIKEKSPFTKNRMNEYASSGTYYFKSIGLMFKAFNYLINNNCSVNGEYYVSLAYKYLYLQKMKTSVFKVSHFMQWGTPQDLREYLRWSKAFESVLDAPNKNKDSLVEGTTIMLMAGLGKRFSDARYKTVKPLIKISNKPMVIQAMRGLPKTKKNVFIVKLESSTLKDFQKTIKKYYEKSLIFNLTSLTDGQASTANEAIKKLNEKNIQINEPLLFAACDIGVKYDFLKYKELIKNNNIDVIVWGIRGHAKAIRNPEMFGWIEEENNIIKNISVKKSLKSITKDPIVIGMFTFKKTSYFKKSFSKLLERKGKVNNEFYLDSCINDAIKMGLRCCLFEIDHFFPWGTPDELKTFKYWQSCFHKWKYHDYDIKKDKFFSY